MRKSMPSGAFVLACILFLGPAPARADVASDEAELRRLSLQWMQALERKDAAALGNILAEDFVLQMPGDPASSLVPRDEWLRNAMGRDWSRARYENLRVQVNANQAVLTSRLYFHVSPIPIELDSGVVDTWRKDKGQWRVNHRYLGQSKASDRIKLALGFLAAWVLIGLGLGTTRLLRRWRSRPLATGGR